MIRLLKCEMMKLLKSFPLKILLLLMLALSFVTSLSSLSYVGSPNADAMEIALYGYDAFFSSLRDTPTITVISIIVIGLMVCGDFENRTIPMEIAIGYSRSQILFSKLISVAVANIIVFIPYPIGRAIFQGIFIGFGVPITITAIINMMSVFLVVVTVGLAINGITILLSFIIRKSIIVMGAGFVLVVLGGNVLLSFGYTNPSIGAFLANTPIGLIKAMAAAQYTPKIVLQAFGISVVCIACFVALTYLLLRKAELK